MSWLAPWRANREYLERVIRLTLTRERHEKKTGVIETRGYTTYQHEKINPRSVARGGEVKRLNL